MALSKIYSRINWENSPNTLLNERNLNRMDLALYELDNRVISQEATKANKTSLNNLISDWTVDEETGIITVTKYDGSKIMFDLNIEKIPVNFVLSDDGILTMTTDDGTAFSANIGAMIPVLTFEDSDTIAVSVTGAGVNKTYSFSIKANSVTADMLQPDYLAEVQTAAGQASVAASEAVQSAAISADKATLAKSYASGGTGTRPGEDKDNAYYYMTQAKKQTGDIPTFLSQLEDDIGFITEEEVNERLGDADISGIGDGTVTGAIEKVNNNLQWKQIDAVTGSTRVLIPRDYSEITVSVGYTEAEGTKFCFHFAKGQTGYFRQSYFEGNNDFGSCRVLVDSAPSIYVNFFKINGVSKIDNATLNVWYR